MDTYTRTDNGQMNTENKLEDIGSRLDKAMKDAKIPSQKALERLSGVPQATISRTLSNSSAPELENLRKLAAACNVNLLWLHEGIGPQRRGAKVSEDVDHQPRPALAAKRGDETMLERLNMEEFQLVTAWRTLEKAKDAQLELIGHARLLVKKLQKKSAGGRDDGQNPGGGK